MHKYKTLETFTKALRKTKKGESIGDWVHIGGHWYVMEEYDGAGQYLRYASITNGTMIDVETRNRYEYGMIDAKCDEYRAECYRFAPAWYIDMDTWKAMPPDKKWQLYEHIAECWNWKEVAELIHNFTV